uniref:Protein OSCP1 n=2 Tax=Coccolithus braarudii TaxID=221442 RepID=A0A7S0LWA0_9EUKA|mmetsp:Transcript_923/g.1860  ORF Transcript_923/g.1860 Transcript_923/m.1860 type:complete len:383 (+) Transcript_923:237-1385(+)|eukprot:CAMPEP_0183339894 /NCGR_PEP_ID=MMETSP0164_2-20130417/6647_1 /TAXON_ID=221442 /ORGANISM="Coccolithus pelagicus ssp braarudi, Strain PLY182g" /LENGTH=382 /DNA_ID=CAMNT_0025509963 /DNA_START=217 /DNA_END=1365 /DNA_ORIENTATION=+
MDAAMPMLIINMGGEMVYILEQRLQAQNVPIDKGKRVLQDVVRTMFNPKFIAELFRSQDAYSMASTRQIFDRLAHSSIMRLNESSMDKLFDLMTMGFKYQMLACAFPHELLQVTLNHLHELRSKVEDAVPVAALVDEVITTTNSKYASMSLADYAGLKQALCRFFSDKRIKVSLFLQDGIQKPDGTIALSCSGALPPGVDVPGKISYYDTSGSTLGVDSFLFPVADELMGAQSLPDDGCRLGLNLYSKEKNHVAMRKTAAASTPSAVAAAARTQAAAAHKIDSVSAEKAILQGGRTQQSTAHLNLLAELVGGSTAPTDNFKLNLNLFPESSSASGASPAEQLIVIDAAGSNHNLVGIMDELRVAGDSQHSGNDDLLDLMDNA